MKSIDYKAPRGRTSTFKESPEKNPFALLITRLPAGRQGFRKKITEIFSLFLNIFQIGVIRDFWTFSEVSQNSIDTIKPLLLRLPEHVVIRAPIFIGINSSRATEGRRSEREASEHIQSSQDLLDAGSSPA